MNQTIGGSYQLEVSSPGIERPLKTLDAVARFSGRRVALTTFEPRDGRRNFEGLLLGPDPQGRAGVRIEDGTEHWFEWPEVRSARLVVNPWARAGERAEAHSGGGRAFPAESRRFGSRRRRGGVE
jgi:ribosome maturation factor RimP